MNKSGITRSLTIAIAAAASLCIADAVHATGGSWGSRGGSLGYGSWGGSSGGFARGGSLGSRGFLSGTPVRNLLGRVRGQVASLRGGSWGSRGGYASTGYGSRGWGASRGSFVSHGSTGYSSTGYGSYGSSHGGSTGYTVVAPANCGMSTIGCPGDCNVVGTPIQTPTVGPMSTDGYYTPDVVVPDGAGAIPAEGDPSVFPQDPPQPQIGPGTEGDASGGGDTRFEPAQPFRNAVLNVKVPVEAEIWVNGTRTSTAGDFRSYVSRHLKPGKSYKFNVLAKLERNGKYVNQEQSVVLRAGSEETLDFDFSMTQLTLNVPADATVKLSGNTTKAIGAVRYFKTRSLKPGESWKNYEVEVSVVRNGKLQTAKRVLNIESGERVRLDFAFDQVRGMYVSN